MVQLIHRVALTALLGTSLVACAGAQQDNQASSAPGKPAAPPTAQSAPQVAAPADPSNAPLGFPTQPRVRQFVIRPPQGMQQHGPAPRMRVADGPRLGVAVAVTPDGLQVSSIDDGSLAQAAGVKEKDVLLRIGDAHVRDTTDIQHALMAYKPGDTVKVAVIRAGEGIVELQGVMPEPKAPPTPPSPPAPPAADGFKGGFLGVQMAAPHDDKDAAGSGDGAGSGSVGSSVGPGVLVADVVPDSAAWFAGLQKGDRLLAVDGKTLGSSEDLVGAVSGKEPGSLVELRYSRDGSEHTVQVRLGHRAPAGPFGGLPMFDDPSDQDGQMMPGMPPMSGLRLRFDDKDWQPFAPGQDGDGDVFHFMHDPQHSLNGAFKGFDIGNLGPGSQSVQIQIDDGKGSMTITRDGKTETYSLDGNGNWVPQDGHGDTAPDAKPDDTQAPRVRNG